MLDNRYIRWFMYCLMVVDHLGIVMKWPGIARMPGRVVFPYFAACAAANSIRSRDPGAYGWRLMVLGLLSQVPYTWALGVAGPNDVLYLALIAGLVYNSKLNKLSKWPSRSKPKKYNILNYWQYAIYPVHLVVLGVIREIITK